MLLHISPNVRAFAMASINTDFSPALHGLRGGSTLRGRLYWYQIFPAFGRVIGDVFPADSMLNPASYLGFGWMGVPLFLCCQAIFLVRKSSVNRSLSLS